MNDEGKFVSAYLKLVKEYGLYLRSHKSTESLSLLTIHATPEALAGLWEEIFNSLLPIPRWLEIELDEKAISEAKAKLKEAEEIADRHTQYHEKKKGEG